MTELVCLFVAFGIFFFLWKSRLNYLLLGRLPLVVNAPAPDLTVIIPARNEAHQIGRAVRSFTDVPIIVVDDASTDATATGAREAGATVVRARPLTANALGKPNACATGAALATTKWLLFVDADTQFQPVFAASAVHFAETHNVDLLSAFLEQQCVTLFEKMLLPYAFALFFTGVSARAVQRADSRSALANGQCLLMRREAYLQTGGHSAVLTSVIEDVALAREAKRHHFKVAVLRAEHLGRVRMYTSLRSIWLGFKKNSFRFVRFNPGGGLQVIAASILLTSWLPAILLGLRDYPSPLTLPLLLTPTPVLLLFLAPFLTLLPWYGLSRILLAPLGIYVFQLIALDSMAATLLRRKTEWKGRRV